MSEQATTAQIDYIISLKGEWAHLVGQELPDYSNDPVTTHTVKNLVSDAFRAETDGMTADEIADRGGRRALRSEVAKRVAVEYVATLESEWHARQAALAATTEGLSKTEASDLINALKGSL